MLSVYRANDSNERIHFSESNTLQEKCSPIPKQRCLASQFFLVNQTYCAQLVQSNS